MRTVPSASRARRTTSTTGILNHLAGGFDGGLRGLTSYSTTRRGRERTDAGRAVPDMIQVRTKHYVGVPERGVRALDDADDISCPLLGHCRFRDCRHDREPGCAVQEAVARGEIAAHRVALLHRLMHEARGNKASFA